MPKRKVRPKPLSRQMFRLGVHLSTRVLPIVFLLLLILYALANQAGMSAMPPNGSNQQLPDVISVI